MVNILRVKILLLLLVLPVACSFSGKNQPTPSPLTAPAATITPSAPAAAPAQATPIPYNLRLPLLDPAATPTPAVDAAAAPALVAAPGPLYVMDAETLDQFSLGAQITFQSLQGIVNQTAPPQIFINRNDGERHDARWLAWLAEAYGVSPVTQNDFQWYLAEFAPSLRGYILFDSRQAGSVNVALSLAGILRAVVVDAQTAWLAQWVNEAGLPQLADVRQYDAAWLRHSEYWAQLNHREAAQLHPLAGLPNLRDFGVARRMPFFFNDTPRDPGLQAMQDIISGLEPGAVIYGWGYTDKNIQEDTFVSLAAEASLAVVPSDRAANLSVYMHYPLPAPLIQTDPPAVAAEINVHTVTFIMSDGDNIQAILNKFAHPAHDLYAGPNRGQVPIGWTLPPTMAGISSPVAAWIYRQATPNDYFLAGPSGAAYVYPSLVPNRADFAAQTGAMLARMDSAALVTLDFNAAGQGFNAATLAPFTARPEVAGIFFVAYDWADPPAGSILWSNGKPAFSTTRLGYGGPAPAELDALAETINSRPKDAASPAGYSAIYAHLWAVTAGDLAALAQRLGPGVRVVRPDVFIQLARENLSP